MQNNYIFLDIDGVLNHNKFYQERATSKKELRKAVIKAEQTKENKLEYYKSNIDCTGSLLLINKLVEETNSIVICSSSWRSDGIEKLNEIFEYCGATFKFTDVTPHLNYKYDDKYHSCPRGTEIEWYLRHMLNFSHINWSKEKQQEQMIKSNVKNYIIIDDDSDMLYTQRNHFIHVLPSPRNNSGFNPAYYETALNTLSKDILTLNY